jgi:ATP-dependent Clp protease ATP-binding subunit ClpC
MAERRMCDVCGVRPAVTTMRRIGPGEAPRTQYLCEVHAAQARGGRTPFGGRSSIGGGGLFDDFFNRFFDEGPRRIPIGGGGASPGRQAEQVDITQFFSDSTSELLQRAAQQAAEWGSLDLNTEHLLWATLEDEVARRVLAEVDANPDALEAQLEEEANKGARSDVSLSLAPDAKRALLSAYEESQALGASYIGPEHVLLALAKDEDSEARRLLSRFGVSHTKLRGIVVRGVHSSGEAREQESSTPTLDEYSRDLTQMAREGKLDPVIGRAEEVETTIEILSRRTKNNPVLIGDPGVGKTAIVEGIAQRIVNDEVPETLTGRRVLALDLAGMVAGTKFRGEFEERLKKVIDEIREYLEEQIIFIDELHTVVGAGAAEGSMDASNMLKPALGPLRRTIQRRVDNDLSRMVLEGSLNPGDKVIIAEEDGNLTFELLEGTSAIGASVQTEASE